MSRALKGAAGPLRLIEGIISKATQEGSGEKSWSSPTIRITFFGKGEVPVMSFEG